MGSRDKPKKEIKKPKKDNKKSPQLTISEPKPVVEIVRKARKPREEGDD